MTRWMFVNVTGRFRRRCEYLIRNMRSISSFFHNSPRCLGHQSHNLLDSQWTTRFKVTLVRHIREVQTLNVKAEPIDK